ncbi:uncharacterized protein LOC124320199 isoform X1 [Daphnia pulicaria]|uniref:uncharacterized protein LOC124320199 isoform X1 n=2 Tax=Daphnia pulicaria TaxID=35523 RepID=UPI001EEC7186|nr:uncharacterized protein LOC124320199 isoform X1 [Daphnia pulicaria]
MAAVIFMETFAILPALFVAGLFIATGSAQSAVNCNRTTLDQCLKAIEPLLNSPAMAKGIPSTKEAVQARCAVFKVGMSCIDEFKDHCLNQRQKIQMERAVAGAQHTFAFLCDDPVFQSEFLQHQSCLHGTSDDWERCAYHFQNMVAEELAANLTKADRNLGLCCAKHGFLRCVYYAAQFKCRKEEALFLMRVAQTLTESQVHENACKKIKFDEVCASDSSVPTVSSMLLTLVAIWWSSISFLLTRH